MSSNPTQERPIDQTNRAALILNQIIQFSKKRPLIAGAAAVILLMLIFLSLRGGGNTADASAYFKVERGDFLVSITEGGNLQAVNEVTVRNEVAGNSRIIYIIPEGTYVEKGDLVVELDSETVENNLNAQLIRSEDDNADFVRSETDVIITRSSVESDIRKAELEVQFAQMDLQKFEEIEKEQEVRNAQIEIITAEESLKLAEERLEWSKKLTEEGFETKSNLDRDQLSVTNQSLGLEKAKNVKKMLTEFDLAKMEAEYKAQVEEAEQELERVRTEGESKIRQALSQLEIDRRQLELGNAKLAQLQEQMDATKIYAPQAGLITYAVASRYSSESQIEEGATIRQRQAIVKIPDTTSMKVEIKVHESHVNQVEVGQRAFVVLDSLPDDRFAGVVSKIAILPDPANRYGNTNLKVYSTEVLIEDELPDIKPGASARAEVVITNMADVIKVPIQCVTSVGGKQVCYVKSLTGDKPVEVEVGLFNNKFIEIKSGLNAGDRIMLAPPFDNSIDLSGALINEGEEVETKPAEKPARQEKKNQRSAESKKPLSMK